MIRAGDRFGGVRLLLALGLALVGALAVQVAPAAAAGSNTFAGAGAISGKELSEGEAFGSTKTATKEAGEPNHAGNPGGGSVWFSLTLSQTQEVEIGTCGGFDSLLGVYTGSAVNELTEIAGNDESALTDTGCGPTDAGVRLTMTGGVKYMIAVDRKEGVTGGSFQLQIQRIPFNDDFADAEVVPVLPATLKVDNRAATKEAGEPAHAGYGGDDSVWYEWTAPKNGLVSLETCAAEHSNTALAVYTGSAVGELTEIASNDDAGGLCHSESELRFEASEGVTYMIALDGIPDNSNLRLWASWVLHHTLTVEKAGSGEGTVSSEPGGIECGAFCEALFARQTMADYYDGAARLTATPAPGSVFTGWSGDADCDGGPTVNPCAWLMVDADATLVATFELEEELPKSSPPEEGDEEQKAGPPAPPALDPAPPVGRPHRPKCRKHPQRHGAQRAKPCKRGKHRSQRR